MGTRADFYLSKYNKLKWIGSLYKDGQPSDIPTDILIQTNPVMYEELVIDFLESKNAVIRSNDNKWPWPWADSRMTDYSYIFMGGAVFAYYSLENILFDPLKIKQGHDLQYAAAPYTIKFPLMNKKLLHRSEEILEKYGFQSTATL